MVFSPCLSKQDVDVAVVFSSFLFLILASQKLKLGTLAKCLNLIAPCCNRRSRLLMQAYKMVETHLTEN